MMHNFLPYVYLTGKLGRDIAPVKWAGHNAPIKWAGHISPVKWAGHAAPVKWVGHAAPIKWAGHISPVKWAGHTVNPPAVGGSSSSGDFHKTLWSAGDCTYCLPWTWCPSNTHLQREADRSELHFYKSGEFSFRVSVFYPPEAESEGSRSEAQQRWRIR